METHRLKKHDIWTPEGVNNDHINYDNDQI